MLIVKDGALKGYAKAGDIKKFGLINASKLDGWVVFYGKNE